MITANTSAIWRQAAHITYQLPFPSFSIIMQGQAKKACIVTKHSGEILGGNSGKWTISRKMARQTEQQNHAGRRTRKKIGKGNQNNDRPEIPDGGVTSDTLRGTKIWFPLLETAVNITKWKRSMISIFKIVHVIPKHLLHTFGYTVNITKWKRSMISILH